MIYAEAFLLAAAAVLGGFCSYSDIQRGIIPNKLLLYAMAAGAIGHTALLICGAAPYYPTWLVNMALADLIAFLLYRNRMWAAGDAKLFMAMYFLMPPPMLDAGGLTYSIIPYSYIFLPALGWMALDSMIRFLRKEPRKKQGPVDWKKMVVHCVIIMLESTALFCLAEWAIPEFVHENEMFAAALIMIYAWFCGSVQFMRKVPVILGHALTLLAAWILGAWKLTIPDWRTYLLMAGVILFQRITSGYNYRLVDPQEIREGMIPAADTVLLFRQSRVHDLPTDFSEELTAKITKEEADAVRRWSKTAKGQARIWIVRKVPFAFMISLGFIGWALMRITR